MESAFGSIGLDDVKINLGQCPAFGSCTFEGKKKISKKFKLFFILNV
jgi:hypothetical protein